MAKLTKKEIAEFNIETDNLGFTWEVLMDIIPDNFKRVLLHNGLQRLMETARYTGKTFLMCVITLFCLLNFNDYNAFVGRKDKQTHFKTTIVTYKKVAKMLYKKYDIDLGPDSPFVKWNTAESNANPAIIYKDRRIMFSSVGKFSDADLGLEFETGGLGDIWADEVSAPSKDEASEDNSFEIHNNVRQILGSAIRGDFIQKEEPIKSWSTIVPAVDNDGRYIDDENGKEFTFYIDGQKIKRTLKTEEIYFYKKIRITYTLNPWDASNFFHDKYYEELWEKDFTVTKILEEQNSLVKIVENGETILMRARTWAAKDNGYLNQNVEQHLLKLKITDPVYYKTVVDGEVLENEDESKYVYREAMKNLNIIDLNKTNYVGKLKIAPEYITIGIDWGWSKTKAKKSAIEVSGVFARDNKAWNFYIFLDEWVERSKSTRVEDEQRKIEKAGDFIHEQYLKYQNQMPIIITWVDEADKTVASSIQDYIYRRYGIKYAFELGAKHDSQNMWGINSRTQFGKELLASGRVFMDPKKTPEIYKEFKLMLKTKGSQKRDPRCANDNITAWEYSLTKLRFFIKKSYYAIPEIKAI